MTLPATLSTPDVFADPRHTAQVRITASRAHRAGALFPESLGVPETDVQDAQARDTDALLAWCLARPADLAAMVTGRRMPSGQCVATTRETAAEAGAAQRGSGGARPSAKGPTAHPVELFGMTVLRCHQYEGAALILSDARLSAIALDVEGVTTLGAMALAGIASLRPLPSGVSPRPTPPGVDPRAVTARVAAARALFLTGCARADAGGSVPVAHRRDASAVLTCPWTERDDLLAIVRALPRGAESMTLAV